jgi:hypothetical protein
VNARHCCRIETPGGKNAPPPASSRLRRGRAVVGWIVPSATLALLPKVPGMPRRLRRDWNWDRHLTSDRGTTTGDTLTGSAIGAGGGAAIGSTMGETKKGAAAGAAAGALGGYLAHEHGESDR